MSQIPFRDRVSCTVEEACEATGLGRTTLYKLIKERRVAKKKIGRRTVLLVSTLLAEIESSSPKQILEAPEEKQRQSNVTAAPTLAAKGHFS
jgi:excisionase family DNA binding protein